MVLAHLFRDVIDVFLCRNNVYYAVRNACSLSELCGLRIKKYPNSEEEDQPTSVRANAEKGVSGGGLITAVQPAARAAPNFRVIIADGKFQGVRMDLLLRL